MGNAHLESRLQTLRAAQNADGGWGYYAGKASWTEPTVFAALALHGKPEAQRAWDLLHSWKLPDGPWKPAAEVTEANWTTALAVLLAQARGEQAASAIRWLQDLASRNRTWEKGWSWRDGNAPAAEPTAWTILALRRAGLEVSGRFLLDDQLTPETCGPALVGLQDSKEGRTLTALAVEWEAKSPSPLTRAWLRLGLRLNGVELADPASPPPRNLAIAALEALASKDGNHRLLRTEVRA